MKLAAILFSLLICTNCLAESALDSAERLVLETRYDDALLILNETEENTARYHYNRLLCEYSLFLKKEGIVSARKLLSFDNLPARYKYMGEHIQYELENLNEDTLEHVASLMKDSGRRLNLGHGGPKVQNVQSKTVAILDYLIEKMEQQNGGGGASEDCPGEQGKSKRNESEQAANESTIKGDTATGAVNKKNIGSSSGWGELPPKEQAAAKQHFDKTFPSHYSRIVEEYNKRMAERKRKR